MLNFEPIFAEPVMFERRRPRDRDSRRHRSTLLERKEQGFRPPVHGYLQPPLAVFRGIVRFGEVYKEFLPEF